MNTVFERPAVVSFNRPLSILRIGFSGTSANRRARCSLINAAQAAEHYEITRYGTLVTWAKRLGRDDCAAVLQKTLDEEKETDRKLTQLAESGINLKAAS